MVDIWLCRPTVDMLVFDLKPSQLSGLAGSMLQPGVTGSGYVCFTCYFTFI